MTTYVLNMLREVGMSESFARAALPRIKISSMEANEVIWAKGANVDCWQLIMDGVVAAAAPTQEREKLPVTIYGHHAWFGEQAILTHNSSPFEYICATAVQVLKVPVSLVLTAFDEEPAFSKYLARLVAWRAQVSTETLALMKFGNPTMRAVLGLALFAEALSTRSTRPAQPKVDKGLMIPVNQSVLASLCGVSRTVFSENVRILEQEGWLRIRYSCLELAAVRPWQCLVGKLRQQRLQTNDLTIEDLLEELDLCNHQEPICA